MPIRMLRDWTDSEPVNGLDDSAEVLFTRLIMKADDYGRFTANPKLIRSLCFPLRDGIRESDISRRIAECETAGLLATYTAKGKPLLQIVKFGQRLRNSKAKYDPPPKEIQDLVDAASRGELPQVAATSGLNGNRNRMETETELETDSAGFSKFCLGEEFTDKSLRTPEGAQKLYEQMLAEGMCTVDERGHVFRLVLSVAANKKTKNVASTITAILRGGVPGDRWQARGSDMEQRAKDWIRKLEIPPAMQERMSNLLDTKPSGSLTAEMQRRLREIDAAKGTK